MPESAAKGSPEALPAAVLEVLRTRSLSFNEIAALAGMHGSALIVLLRRAEAAGSVRYARGSYEAAAPPVIGLTGTLEPPAAPPIDPFHEADGAVVDASTLLPVEVVSAPPPKPKPAPIRPPATIKAVPTAPPAEEPMAKAPEMRECKACHESQPLDNKHFCRNAGGPGGFESRCNKCKAAGILIPRAGKAKRAPAAKSAPAAPPTRRLEAAGLHIPAQAELRAAMAPGGGVALSSGARQLELTAAQMDQLAQWWHDQKAAAA